MVDDKNGNVVLICELLQRRGDTIIFEIDIVAPLGWRAKSSERVDEDETRLGMAAEPSLQLVKAAWSIRQQSISKQRLLGASLPASCCRSRSCRRRSPSL